MKLCKSCGDPVSKYYDSELGREVNPSPYCRDCFEELKFDKVPNVLSKPEDPSKVEYPEEVSDSDGMRKRKRKRKPK